MLIINGINLNDYGLILTDCTISTPDPITHLVSIPGRREPLDLTESLYGEVTYKQRKLTFEFAHRGSQAAFVDILSQLTNQFHGQAADVVFFYDPGWVWHGRGVVEGSKDSKSFHKLTYTLTADPYKKAVQTTAEEWEWDTFSFETGIIRNYTDIQIPDDKKLSVIGSPSPVTPSISPSVAMTVSAAGMSWDLPADAWTPLTGLKIGRKETELAFNSAGTVSISIREESL